MGGVSLSGTFGGTYQSVLTPLKKQMISCKSFASATDLGSRHWTEVALLAVGVECMHRPLGSKVWSQHYAQLQACHSHTQPSPAYSHICVSCPEVNIHQMIACCAPQLHAGPCILLIRKWDIRVLTLCLLETAFIKSNPCSCSFGDALLSFAPPHAWYMY